MEIGGLGNRDYSLLSGEFIPLSTQTDGIISNSDCAAVNLGNGTLQSQSDMYNNLSTGNSFSIKSSDCDRGLYGYFSSGDNDILML